MFTSFNAQKDDQVSHTVVRCNAETLSFSSRLLKAPLLNKHNALIRQLPHA